jgi:hypothetical protein
MVEAARWHGLAKCEIPAARLATMSLFTEKENTRYLKDRSKKSAERYLEYIGNDKDVVRLIMQTKVVGEKSKHRSLDAHFLDLVDRVCTLAARPFFQMPGQGTIKVNCHAILTTIETDLAQTNITIDPRVMCAVQHFMDKGWLDEALGADLYRMYEKRGRQNIAGASTAGAARTTLSTQQQQEKIQAALAQLKVQCIEVPEGTSKLANPEDARFNAGKYLMASVDIRCALQVPIAAITLDSAIPSDATDVTQTVLNHLQIQQLPTAGRRAPMVAYLNKVFDLYKDLPPDLYELLLECFSLVLTDPVNLQILSNIVLGLTYTVMDEAAAQFARILPVEGALVNMVPDSFESSEFMDNAQRALGRRYEYLENLADSAHSDEEKERLLRTQCGEYEPVLNYNEYAFAGQKINGMHYAFKNPTVMDAEGNLHPRPEPSRAEVLKVNIRFLKNIRNEPTLVVKNAAEVFLDKIILETRAYLAHEKAKRRA